MAKGINPLLIMALVAAAAETMADDVPTDTYKQTCEIPPFEWAAYGTRLTGRMYTRRAAILGDSLYAAGYLKSTGAPDKENFEETDEDFGVTGPYTSADPTGASAFWVTSDLVSYTTEHGSFAQYEVGVVKIEASTGRPQDVFVYYGEGQDETCGLAVKETTNGNEMALSGHFVGRLSADHGDGTTTTIFNSNSNGTANYVQHPNAIKNGFDDGFIISADADTGDAKWMVAYPKSNKDAQTVGVDLDGVGNIYGAGYACNQDVSMFRQDGIVICDGFVAKFAANDGNVVWERKFTDLGAAMWIVYDETDESLYVTGTTSYFGESSETATPKVNEHCNHDICAVTMRLSAVDGKTDWIRTTKGSPRWNFFDQTGDVELANKLDGPYIYVAVDDVGEEGLVTLDEGTSYAACRDEDGTLTPEHLINSSRLVTADDCPLGSTFVPRMDSNAFPAADAATDAKCGAGHESVDACIIKYHKFTGLPIWGSDIHPIAGLAPSADGQSVMATGWYWGASDIMGHHFDSVSLPDYNGVEGSYAAKLNAATGQGEYVLHSGGVGKTRVYDAVSNAEGDIFMVGYTQASVVNWGGTLQTKIIEEGVDQNDDQGTAFQMGKVSSNTKEYQFFAVKLAATEPVPLSCIETCSLEGDKIANPVVKDGHCLIDNVCYVEGATSEIFGRPCLLCKPNESQTEWSFADTVGDLVCFIDNICFDEGDYYTFRESRSVIHTSMCQHCDPADSATGWSVNSNFEFVSGTEPPNDCLNITDSPTAAPTKSPVKAVTSLPIEPSVTSSADNRPVTSSADIDPVTSSADIDPVTLSVDIEPVTSPTDNKGNVIVMENAGNNLSSGAIAGLVSVLLLVLF